MPSNLTFHIKNTQEMIKFGKLISQVVQKQNYKGFILFYGSMGSGKTTFTRGFVENLPKGDQAEITSPSFTLCNNYPTEPEVIHCDLYRFPEIQASEVNELFDDFSGIILIEWSEHLPKITYPNTYLHFHFSITSCSDRKVTCSFYGIKEQNIFQKIKQQKEDIQSSLITFADQA